MGPFTAIYNDWCQTKDLRPQLVKIPLEFLLHASVVICSRSSCVLLTDICECFLGYTIA